MLVNIFLKTGGFVTVIWSGTWSCVWLTVAMVAWYNCLTLWVFIMFYFIVAIKTSTLNSSVTYYLHDYCFQTCSLNTLDYITYCFYIKLETQLGGKNSKKATDSPVCVATHWARGATTNCCPEPQMLWYIWCTILNFYISCHLSWSVQNMVHVSLNFFFFWWVMSCIIKIRCEIVNLIKLICFTSFYFIFLMMHLHVHLTTILYGVKWGFILSTN